MRRLTTSVDHAVSCIRHGQIVAFPTETYYGLAVDPFNKDAVERLYALKNRPIDKPLLVLVSDISQLAAIAARVPQPFPELMERYWPGPLTLVFPAHDSINSSITGGTGTVGVRISPHPLAAQLVNRFGRAITATSANLSGMDPAKNADEVLSMFGDSIDIVLDGGETAAGLCSTVVGMRGSQLVILRKGQVDIGDMNGLSTFS